MKKNRLCVCLHLGSKEYRFYKLVIVTDDSWNLVGPWVIEVGEFKLIGRY